MLRATAIFAFFALAISSFAQFSLLGTLPSQDSSTAYSQALHISRDGTTVVGRSTAYYKNLLEDKLTAFLWNEGASMIQIGDDTEILSGYDIACSGNGSVIAGNATYYLGGIDGDGDFLYKNGALSYFEPIADAGIITYVTPDGSKVLGYASSKEAFGPIVYDLTTRTFKGVQVTEGHYFQIAAGNQTGTLLVGADVTAEPYKPCYWTVNPVTGDYNLNTFTLPSGYEEGILGSVSEDGTKLAGVAQNSLGKSLGFVYSVPSETFTFFPGPDGAQLTSATITDNGGLVVGNYVDSVNNQQGYVWSVDQPAAAQTARAFFTNHGVTPTTEPFTLNDVSAIGKAFCGTTNYEGRTGKQQAWYASIVYSNFLTEISFTAKLVTGGSVAAGTVTLNKANSTGQPYSVGLEVTAGGTVKTASVPASIEIANGSSTQTFNMSTDPVSVATLVTVTATCEASSVSTTIEVVPVMLISVLPKTATVLGTKTADFTANLNGPSPGSFVVTLTSSNTKVLKAPASVVIGLGASSAVFPVATYAVSADTKITVTGKAGTASDSGTITVQEAMVTSFKAAASTVTGGNPLTMTIDLNGAAGPTGDVIKLSTSSTVVPVPVSLTVPAGYAYIGHSLKTSPVSVSTTVKLIASTADSTATATVVILPPKVTSLSPGLATLLSGKTESVVLGLNGEAPPAGLTVTLSSSNSKALSVPASVVVKSLAVDTTFTATALTVTAATPVVVTASGGGGTKTATITVDAPPPVLCMGPVLAPGDRPDSWRWALAAGVADGSLDKLRENPA